jgi:hypothetical protein
VSAKKFRDLLRAKNQAGPADLNRAERSIAAEIKFAKWGEQAACSIGTTVALGR